MAWVSVHEQVLGAKLRKLARRIGCSQNEALGLLVRLWLWGIHNADESGEISDGTKEDVVEVLAAGLQDGIDSGSAVERLIDTEWIDIHDNKVFLHDWGEWQEQWYKALIKRKKTALYVAKHRAKVKEELDDTIKEKPVQKATVYKEKKPDKSTSARNYSSEFEAFWAIYPRKIGKVDAYKCYCARLNDGWTPSELIDAVTGYRKQVIADKTEEKYIKHAKTFLSAATPFIDYIKKGKVEREEFVDDDDPYKDWREKI